MARATIDGVGIEYQSVGDGKETVFLLNGIACRIPGARYEEIPDAGHAVVIEKPAAVSDSLLGFLVSIAGNAAG